MADLEENLNVVLRPQRIISLCSGAGGLDLGVHGALGGCARTVVFVEHEVTACEVLVARIADGALDDAPIWGDLHTFDGRGWRGRVDGIIGGYPCQPFSVAGKRLGTADPRHLWPSIERIIGEVEPAWCFFENVGGHLRLGYFDVVKPGLERLGYGVAEGLFTAAEVGAPHQRERLFILGVADAQNDHRWRGECGAETGTGEERIGRGRLASGGEHVADTTSARRPGAGEYDGRPSPLPARPEQRDGGLDNAESIGRQDGQPILGGHERQESDDGRGRLADAGDGQLSEPWRGAQGRDGAGPAGAMVHADEPGLEGRGRSISERGNERAAWRPSSPFPPGPGDRDAWERILAEHPDLAPAVEPSVRLLAHELAPGMDLSRTAQLRITGNGVVPMQSALALHTLWRQLADPGHPERKDGLEEG